MVVNKSISAVFTRKYLLVLGLLFAVSLAAFVVFQHLLQTQVSPAVFNLVSRQRVLTHRVALYSVLYTEDRGDAEHDQAGRDLNAALDELERAQATLKEEAAHGSLRQWWFSDYRLGSKLAVIDLGINALSQDARLLLKASPAGQGALRAAILAQATDRLCAELDTFLDVFEAIGAERGERLQLFAIVGEGMTIFLLILSGMAVFQPLVSDIERRVRQVGHLENYYRSIINNVGDGVITFDQNNTTRYVNSAVEAMWQRQSRDLVGQPIAEILPAIAEIPQLFEVPTRRLELAHARPDGSQAIFDVSIYIFEFEGERQCIVSLRDITERKALENRLRTFFYGIEHSPLSIVITDMRGVIEFANRRCMETSGFELEEIIGRTPRIFRSGETPQAIYQALWGELLAGREWYGEILNRRKNGELYWEFEAVSAIKNEIGAITHFIAIKEDVTEQKRAAAALIEAKRAAECANRAKSEFLANMSHELRTPLNAIIGFGEIMKMELFGLHTVPAYKEYSLAVFESAKHLLGIINDILDFSKLEAGKVELFEEKVKIDDLMASVLVIAKERADSRGVHLEVVGGRDMPQLYVDPLRIKQVLLNLLGNAIKFTPAGGVVTMTARMAANHGLRFEIADTGIGMKEDDIPRALERFGQVESSLARKYEGTGLGLPISKTLVELHGGTLALKSKLGHGTTAIVTLGPERLIFQEEAVTAEI